VGQRRCWNPPSEIIPRRCRRCSPVKTLAVREHERADPAADEAAREHDRPMAEECGDTLKIGWESVAAVSDAYSMKVIVIASPAASPLKKSSRLPEVTSSSAAAMIRWNTSSDEKRSRTASPTAGAPLQERSTTSRIESSSGVSSRSLCYGTGAALKSTSTSVMHRKTADTKLLLE